MNYVDGVTSSIQTQLNGKAASSHVHAAGDITSGTLGVARGGTGKATHTSNAILTGNGTSAVNNVATASGALYATAVNGAAKFGTLPIAQGGTGATTAAAARTALGVTLANLGAKDYPIEAGTSGSWRYIKFNSGLKICFREYTTGTLSVSSLAGGLYYGTLFSSLALPFTFSSFRDVFITNAQTTTGSHTAFICAYETSDNRSMSAIGKSNFIRWTSANCVVKAGILVIGV